MEPWQLQNIEHGAMVITHHWTWNHVNYKTLDMGPCILQNKNWTWDHDNYKPLDMEPWQLQNMMEHGTMSITKHWTWNNGNYKT